MALTGVKPKSIVTHKHQISKKSQDEKSQRMKRIKRIEADFKFEKGFRKELIKNLIFISF